MSLMHLTTCYGRDIEALADLGGDVDVMSADDLAAWNLRHWTEIAAAVGFSKALADAVQSLRKTRLGLVGILLLGRISSKAFGTTEVKSDDRTAILAFELLAERIDYHVASGPDGVTVTFTRANGNQ